MSLVYCKKANEMKLLTTTLVISSVYNYKTYNKLEMSTGITLK